LFLQRVVSKENLAKVPGGFTLKVYSLEKLRGGNCLLSR
jgi:hypothetical protein